MKLAVIVVAIGALAVGATGCCKKRKAPPSYEGSNPSAGGESSVGRRDGPASPPVPQVSDRGDITFAETPGKISSFIHGGEYSVHFDKFLSGTKIKIGDDEKTVSGSLMAMFKVDIGEQLGALTPSEAADPKFKLDPKRKAHLTFPNGVESDVPLSPGNVSGSLRSLSEKAKNGQPILFGNEPDAASAQHTVLSFASIIPETFGPAKTLRDVDWLTYSIDQPPRKGKMCSGYKAANETVPRSLPLEMVDQELVIVERRTGKEIDRKKFTATQKCPMFATGDHAHSYGDLAAMKTWLRTRRAAR